MVANFISITHGQIFHSGAELRRRHRDRRRAAAIGRRALTRGAHNSLPPPLASLCRKRKKVKIL
ncbi:hypothetical protein IF1G_06137 [Cordyceps javanica]|uniref:Uncharacterized protein n=1 Tax=Cordyceps javanica TaxID=43265 RepID=A0A545V0A1_9HYPO|nr:hypothetical protein IF1G_06137 [Cordyceps javanica]